MVLNLVVKFILLEKVIDPFTKPSNKMYVEDTKATTTTIYEMVNQILPDS